ncbi:MAG: hypothetical protein LBG62_02780 [Candidatus Methanoplasma sp.]|jgi:hypothetical protein|nr:hypothetical protein [Candidatus Methanoplasma sp.]
MAIIPSGKSGARALACAAVLLALALSLAVLAYSSDDADAAPVNVTFAKQSGATTKDASLQYSVNGGPWTAFTGSASIEEGSTVSLRASSTSNEQFLYWYGGVNSAETEVSFTVAGPVTVNAKCVTAGPTHIKEVTASVTGEGSVQFKADNEAYIDFPSGGTQKFEHGSPASLRASPAAGSSFIWWSGALSGSAPAQSLSMIDSRIVSATFHSSSDLKTLSTSYALAGSATGTIQYYQNGLWHDLSPSFSVPTGTSLSVRVNIVVGKFLGWDGSLSGQDRIGTVVMDSDKSLSIRLASDNTYPVYPSQIGEGDFLISFDGGASWYEDENVYKYTSSGELTIDPWTDFAFKAVGKNGYEFVYWTGDVPGDPLDPIQHIGRGQTSASRTLTPVFSNDVKTVSAAISAPYSPATGKIQFKLSGTWYDFPAGGLRVPGGDTVTLSVLEDPGCVFLWWTGGITGPAREQSLRVDGDKSVTAVLNRNLPGDNLTLTVNISGPGAVTARNLGLWGSDWQSLPETGTMVIPASGSTLNIDLQATPSSGSRFIWWTGDLASAAPTGSLTMTSNKLVNAVFSSNAHKVTATTAEGSITYMFEGTPTPFPQGGLYVPHGYALELALTGNTTEFKQWTGFTQGTQQLSPTPTLTVNSDLNLVATFLQPMRTVTIVNGPNGHSTPSGEVQVENGGTLNILFGPSEGYKLSDVLVDGSSYLSRMGGYRLTLADVRADCTVESFFALGAYSITASADGGATISPSGTVEVSYGGSQTFRFEPKAGHQITYVVVDGVTVEGSADLDYYMFKNVVQNHTIEVLTGDVRLVLTMEAKGDGLLEYRIGNGAFASYTQPVTLAYGSSVTIRATPAEGNVFKGWWDGKINSTDEVQTISDVRDSWSVLATFGPPEPTAPGDDGLWESIPVPIIWLFVGVGAVLVSFVLASALSGRFSRRS